MRDEIIKYLVGKDTLAKSRNRNCIELMPVEPGLVFVYYEATGEDVKEENFDAGELFIAIQDAQTNREIASADVSSQGALGDYWFKNLPDALDVIALLKIKNAQSEKIIAKSRITKTLGEPVDNRSLRWIHPFRDVLKYDFPQQNPQ